MEIYKTFKIISDAFYGYYSLFQECRKCDKFCGNVLCFHIIKDVISISFIIEIGFKALLTYEGKKKEGTHKLMDLFESLSTERKEIIANAMCCSMTELKEALTKNSNNFVEWRYYYEISETDKRLTNNNEFMDKLLSIIAEVICDLRKDCFHRTDEMLS